MPQRNEAQDKVDRLTELTNITATTEEVLAEAERIDHRLIALAVERVKSRKFEERVHSLAEQVVAAERDGEKE